MYIYLVSTIYFQTQNTFMITPTGTNKMYNYNIRVTIVRQHVDIALILK